MAHHIMNRSSQFEISPLPQSLQQWKDVLSGVNMLYRQRQYKQCAARSREILDIVNEPIHPVYKTYLNFYCAISYEEMGRVAHHYSRKKIPMLNSALDCFIVCSDALPPMSLSDGDAEMSSSSWSWGSSPSLVSLVDFSTTSDFSRPSSPDSSLLSSITDIIEKSLQCPGDDPFLSDNESWVDLTVDIPQKLPPRIPIDSHSLMPSPLQIRKSAADETRVEQRVRPARSRRPPPLPIKIVPAGAMNTYNRGRRESSPCNTLALNNSQNPQPQTSQAQTSMSPSCVDSVNRYNHNVRALRAQIHTSIAEIHALIDEIAALQSARHASRGIRRSGSFWSFSPVKTGSSSGEKKLGGPRRVLVKESKEERIARLRTEGWATVGLKSPVRGWKGAAYYQTYCNSVLDELYLDV